MGEFLLQSARPGLCVTVGGATMTELRRERDEAARVADLVEVRLDRTDAPDAAGAVQGCAVPVLVTCRAAWEGGHFGGSEDERLALLRQALAAGAAYVDVEARAPGAADLMATTGGRRIVLSFHEFTGVPADLPGRAREMAGTPAAVVKIAVRAHALADTLPVLALSKAVGGRPFVGLAMGTAGILTRVLAARVGSCWTYAGRGWAPGQLPADRLLDEMRYRSVSADAAVYAVVGRPILHSVSPAMHNAAFAARGVNAVYLPLEAASAEDLLAIADAIGLAGASVTAPFKLALAAAADLDARAREVGAVNTLRRRRDGWDGTNTDVQGFLTPLDGRLRLEGLRVAVLGTGGAARAVALALRRRGARVTVHGRRLERARAVAALAGGRAAGFQPSAGSWDVLVNTTPVGTAPGVDESPMPGGPFGGRLVYDLVYNPPETRLMREAARAGCAVLGGLEMLVAQAQAQQAFWMGDAGDGHAMRAAAVRRLAADAQPPDETERRALIQQG